MEQIVSAVAEWIKHWISVLGYPGVSAMMAIESACIPLPSEIIMPFSGFLVYVGRFNMHFAALSGAFGEAVGATLAYYAGMCGGRPFFERYGRYVLVRGKDLDRACRVFDRYGESVIFAGRLLPVIRTFISFPAGVARMKFRKFLAYSFAGSVIWCYFLTYVGMVLGKNWPAIRSYFRGADAVVGVVLGVAFLVWLYHHLRPDAVGNGRQCAGKETNQKVAFQVSRTDKTEKSGKTGKHTS